MSFQRSLACYLLGYIGTNISEESTASKMLVTTYNTPWRYIPHYSNLSAYHRQDFYGMRYVQTPSSEIYQKDSNEFNFNSYQSIYFMQKSSWQA
jgi:hypothetical protein